MKSPSTNALDISITNVIKNPDLRRVFVAGHRAGWKERHAVARAESDGTIEATSADAGREPAPMTATDVRDLFDRLMAGDI